MSGKVKRVGDEAEIIGRNLLGLRQSRGYSQRKIADVLGTSFQQIQKYEKGQNRLPIEKLYRLKNLYGVPYADFFIGLDDGRRVQSGMMECDGISYLNFDDLEKNVLKRKLCEIASILAV